MKKLTATLLASTLLGIAAYAQGTVNFINIVGSLNAPMFLSDGTTKLSGSSFTAELFAGTTATALSSVATTGFLTGAGAGYFSGGTVTINSIVPGATGFFQVKIWATSSGSFAAAQTANAANTWAQSSVFQVVTGGGGTPPGTPAPLSGLTSLNLNSGVPEPSTLALAGIGAAALLVFRRRK